MAYVLGIDIGTYGSKGVLVDGDGRIVASRSIAHPLEIPRHGWAEHDAEGTWWHDFKQLSQALIAEGRARCGLHPSQIQAVGMSAIAPAVVPVDRAGRPLRKAILYGIDTRAAGEIDELNRIIGEEAIMRHGGHRLSSQSAGPKISWIRRHEPEVYRNTHQFLTGNGYLGYKLTGVCSIDYYTACAYSPLFDLFQLRWNEEHMKHVAERSKLPPLAWSCDIIGEVTRTAAAETGLSAGTRVIAGTADSLAEAISVGAVCPGDMMVQYGSSTFFIQIVNERMRTDKFWPSVHVLPGVSTLTGGTATAGSVTRWFADQWRAEHASLDETYAALNHLAEKSTPGSDGLIMLPYFSGERTPVHHREARGVLFGLSLKHTTGDMYRSILEGVGYAIRHNIEEMSGIGVQPRKIIAVGGGTRSRLWLQCVSSICGIEQHVPKIAEGASYGNAFLAALGLGWFRKLEDVLQWVEYTDIIRPIVADAAVYDPLYRLYRNIYESTKASMDALSWHRT